MHCTEKFFTLRAKSDVAWILKMSEKIECTAKLPKYLPYSAKMLGRHTKVYNIHT